MFACHLAKHGQIPAQNRQVMPCGFEQRQAKSLTERRRKQGRAALVQSPEQCVTRVPEPEEALAELIMMADTTLKHFGHPARETRNNERDIGTLCPQLLECLQSLRMTFAGFQSADHQERRHGAQSFHDGGLVRRNVGVIAYPARQCIGAEMKVSEFRRLGTTGATLLQLPTEFGFGGC